MKEIEQNLVFVKTSAQLQEIIQKFDLLNLINQSEDNSSELAGFEINKLLKEQSKLESQYNSMINQKNKLKGIKNKQEFLKLQNQINDVSRSLKESTKKLCRLFKENKNLNEDLLKVEDERREVVELIREMLEALEKNQFGQFERKILDMLEGHNQLEQFQKREKELIFKIKKVKGEIQQEQLAYQQEMNEKDSNINTLKDQLNRTKTQKMITLKYQQKELEATEETQARIYKQEEEDLLKEKKRFEEIQFQEEKVFQKNKRFLEKENERLRLEVDQWSQKSIQHQNDLEAKIKFIIAEREKNFLRLKALQEIRNDVKTEKEEEERKLKQTFQDRKEKIEQKKMLEETVILIQFHFENWFDKVGQFMKKKGKK